jgi:hypothetical protein
MTTAFLESEIEQRAALRVPWQRCVYKVHGCAVKFLVSFSLFLLAALQPLPSPSRKRGPVTTGVYWIPAFSRDNGPQNALLAILMLMGRMA